MNGRKNLTRLQFHNDFASDEKIEPALTDHRTFVKDGHDLFLIWDTPQIEFATNSTLIHDLCKPWSQLTVNFDTSANNGFSKLIKFRRDCIPPLLKLTLFHVFLR